MILSLQECCQTSSKKSHWSDGAGAIRGTLLLDLTSTCKRHGGLVMSVLEWGGGGEGGRNGGN